MASEFSKSQIGRLGDRLKKGSITEEDLRLLDEYRRSFTEAYEAVVGAIRNEMMLEPTGRPAKSTTSISEKLLRETIRLTQVQDIAGCRLVVSDAAEQNLVVQSLGNLFQDTTIVDRRQKPSHGYRAVHVIVRCCERWVEIQIRSSLQHLWAEFSEKLSDTVDPALKYGAGDQLALEILAKSSSLVANEELLESEHADMRSHLSRLLAQGNLPNEIQQAVPRLEEKIENVQRTLVSLRQRIFETFREAMDSPTTLGGETDAISD